jgi:hypothetical protein
MLSFSGLSSFGNVTEPLEAAGPIVVEEGAEFGHLVVVRSIQAPSALATFVKEPGFSQNTEMLGDRRSSDFTKGCGDCRGREFLGPDEPKDLAPTRFRQCLERCIHYQ